MRLGTVESIVPLMQSIGEGTNRVLRLEDTPGVDASHPLAGLEYHEKSIQSVDGLTNAATEDASVSST